MVLVSYVILRHCGLGDAAQLSQRLAQLAPFDLKRLKRVATIRTSPLTLACPEAGRAEAWRQENGYMLGTRVSGLHRRGSRFFRCMPEDRHSVDIGL